MHGLRWHLERFVELLSDAEYTESEQLQFRSGDGLHSNRRHLEWLVLRGTRAIKRLSKRSDVERHNLRFYYQHNNYHA